MPDDRQTENVEVVARHIGLGLNPSAWWAVADRLAQPEHCSQAIECKGTFWHGLFYPDPTRAA